jgi:hypothetical protein
MVVNPLQQHDLCLWGKYPLNSENTTIGTCGNQNSTEMWIKQKKKINYDYNFDWEGFNNFPKDYDLSILLLNIFKPARNTQEL